MRGEDALQLDEVGVLLARAAPPPAPARGRARPGTARGVQGKQVVEVAEGEGAALVLELQLAPLQHHAVLVAEDGQQHLVPQLRLHRVPVDVEEVGVERGRPVLQHVLPQRVPCARCPCGWAPCRAPAPARCPGARRPARRSPTPPPSSGLTCGVVHHVVAVVAARHRAEDGRGVEVADAQPRKVGNDGAGLREVEVLVQLHAVGAERELLLGEELLPGAGVQRLGDLGLVRRSRRAGLLALSGLVEVRVHGSWVISGGGPAYRPANLEMRLPANNPLDLGRGCSSLVAPRTRVVSGATVQARLRPGDRRTVPSAHPTRTGPARRRGSRARHRCGRAASSDRWPDRSRCTAPSSRRVR